MGKQGNEYRNLAFKLSKNKLTQNFTSACPACMAQLEATLLHDSIGSLAKSPLQGDA